MTDKSKATDAIDAIYKQLTAEFDDVFNKLATDLGSSGTAILFVGTRDDGSILLEARSLAEFAADPDDDDKTRP